MLAPWHTHTASLIQALPSLAPMRYNLALGLALSGAGLALKFGRFRWAAAAGAPPEAVGLLTRAEFFFDLDLGERGLLAGQWSPLPRVALGVGFSFTALRCQPGCL